MRTLVFLICAVVVTPAFARSRIVGTVVDVSGGPVSGATVTVAGLSVATGDGGAFALDGAPDGPLTLVVTAQGFASTAVPLMGESPVRVVLQPAPLVDAIVVTASRGDARLATPAATTVMTAAELLTAAAGSLDDALRATPGFSLFRRSSSRVSNPTTQGVTLRGVSGSGASRTMVLADGIPLNDPFGSWVYWNRIPQAAIERAEVVRGASGDLYGADALGGVVQLLTFAPERTRLRLLADAGSQHTHRGSGYGSTTRRAWQGLAAAEWLRTDGIVTIGPEVRGPVDTRADSDYGTLLAGVGYNPGPWRASVRGSVYDEHRNNGTPLQVNTTDWNQLSGESAGGVLGGAWQVRASGGHQKYYQTFTAVAADRRSERVTTAQTTPTGFGQGSAQWSRGWGNRLLLAGADARRVAATVEELRFAVNSPATGPFLAGGTETGAGLFGRVSFVPRPALTVVVGARVDVWSSVPTDAALATHRATFLSPRVSASWRLSEHLTAQAGLSRSSRTPTLNELHRGFRAGNVQTNPNPLLDPERLTGIEAGLLGTRNRLSGRLTVFWNQLDQAITNVTVATTAAQITRQRQNTDTVRAAGVEIEGDIRPSARWMFGGVVALTRSRFSATPAQPALAGNRVPQVPSFQLGATATYVDPRGFTGSLQARAVGAQFDDDLNVFRLGAFGVVDASASQELVPGLHVFAAIENLFDADYDTGRTPLRTVGWPRSGRIGVRIFLP